MTAARAEPGPRGARAPEVAADAVACIAVTFLVTDALAGDLPLAAIVLLAAWAALPRIASGWTNAAGLLERTAASAQGRATAAAAAVFAVAAGAVGLLAIPGIGVRGSGTETALLLLVWASALLLDRREAHRAFEVLAGIAMAVALLRGAAHAIPLVGAAFLALAFGAAVKLQATAAGPRRRRPRTGHARTAAAIVTAVLVALLIGLQAGLDPLISERAGPGRTSPRKPRPADARRPERGGTERAGGSHGGGVARPGLRSGSSMGDGEPATVLRVHTGFEPRGGGEPWAPTGMDLWRGWTWTRFVPGEEAWTDAGAGSPVAEAAGSRILRSAPDVPGGTASWDVTVLTPRLDVMLVPYVTPEIELLEGGNAAALVSRDEDGDLWWTGQHVPYRVTVRPFDAVQSVLHAGLRPDTGVDPRYLEVPPSDLTGVDLRALARRVAGREPAMVSAALRGLHRHFLRFRSADDEAVEPAGGLHEFLEERPIGDCRHFATAAALLLRAAGIPTRLVTGYRGAFREGGKGDWYVYGSSAHAWIEVSTQLGWVPVDPTAWVSTYGVEAGESGASEPARERSQPRRAKPLPVWLVWVALAASAAFLLAHWLIARRRRPPREARPEEPPEEVAEAPAPPAAFVPRTPAEELLVEYGRLQEDLADTGRDRRSHETPREHARRIGAVEGEPAAGAFAGLVPLVDDGLYGEVDLTDSDVAAGRTAIELLRRELA